MAIVLDGTANTVTPVNGALGATTPNTVAATTVVASSTIKGATTIAVGNATPSASGAGITFPATQSASTDANTLDDYEEGPWTPAVTFGGGSTGVTYGSFNAGQYTKVGRIVTVCGTLELTSKGSSTGAINITGLPFVGSSFGGAALTLYGVTFTGQCYGQPNASGMSLLKPYFFLYKTTHLEPLGTVTLTPLAIVTAPTELAE